MPCWCCAGLLQALMMQPDSSTPDGRVLALRHQEEHAMLVLCRAGAGSDDAAVQQ